MSYNLYPAILHLQDGTSYKGWSFFELSSSIGEIVFNTGMTGYQEILSDPSYAGQMVVFTYPEIGNTGLNKKDNESNFITIKALIAKNISLIPSSWRSNISLRDYIVHKKLPHIFGLDTRSLTRHLRSSGVMSGVLCSCLKSTQKLSFINLDSVDLVRKVTTRYVYMSVLTQDNPILESLIFPSYSNLNRFTTNELAENYKIVIIDFGIKFSIIKKLLLLDCCIYILPATSSYLSIMQCNPDGILLSNGPGNPLIASYAISTVRKLIKFGNVPIFGICMGHQILNKSFGADTFKLKFGHRGLNHPSGFGKYCEITSQNHGFVVSNDLNLNKSCSEYLSAKYFNLNDSTMAATFSALHPVFSVQYHPEASPGPNDSEYLFQAFIKLIRLIKLKK
ncbi:MAG: glutamine-hydrolyzing carbamoyl-phosphate synthase small subunit [Cyanobacteria bacterium P01_H01_bin.35]